MSGSALLASCSVPAGATAAAPAAAGPTAAAAAAAAPAARSSIFGAAEPREQVLLAKGVDVLAKERKLDQRTQRLPRMNKAHEEEFKEPESLLASAIATAASANASVVRECVRACAALSTCGCTIAIDRAWRARSPSGATPRRRLALRDMGTGASRELSTMAHVAGAARTRSAAGGCSQR
jgi:hypothetical protein